MQIVSNTPLVGEEDPELVAKKFFEQIGYLSKGSAPDIPFKLFNEHFLKHPDKAWYVEELSTSLKTSKPTIYRHLNKLKGFDILEEVHVFDEASKQNKKAYRLRYGNIQKAWNFVEAHLKVAIENYGKTVEHLHALIEKQRKGEK
jgi:predicted transcriptional regulator